MNTTIHWFRNDLRLADNPALRHAAQRGAVVPVFIWNPDEHGSWAPGGAKKWWLHQSLAALAQSLEDKGSRLILRQGDPLDILKDLAKTAKADTVVWNRRYEPALIETDKRIKRGLADADLDAQSFNAALLFEPWQAQTQQGKPYQVYSPFRRFVEALPEPDKPKPAPTPGSLDAPWKWPASDALDDLALMPSIKWYDGLANEWQPGEAGASKRLQVFTRAAIDTYKDDRDYPAKPATSKLSPHLHLGEISPHKAYHAARRQLADATSKNDKKNITHFIHELLWREFGYHVLYHFPHTPGRPLRDKYEQFPWVDMRQGRHYLEAWQQGQTGYPIVDAGMRQLYATGWMHNRVRMIVASFLTKHLLISWEEGAKWFWDTLVDADLASNTLGWQWAGGCGADAAPYFRIFNPMTQGEKFDSDGEYVRKWCPELKDVPTKHIHQPWECPPLELQQAGVTLGEDYPHPIVDHKEARERALEALSAVTGD